MIITPNINKNYSHIMSNNLVDRLKQKQAEIKEKIRKAQKQEAQKNAAIEAKKAKIYGTAFMSAIKDNPNLSEKLHPIIDRYTVNNNERKLLGLPPLEKAPTEENKSIDNDPVQPPTIMTEEQPVTEENNPTRFWKS